MNRGLNNNNPYPSTLKSKVRKCIRLIVRHVMIYSVVFEVLDNENETFARSRFNFDKLQIRSGKLLRSI